MTSIAEHIVDGTPTDIVSRYGSLAQLAENSDFGVLDDNVVVIDTETTGLSYNHDELIQIAAARMSKGEITDWYVTFVNPGMPISDDITHLTHITDEMVADKPPVDEVIRRFHAFVGDSILVGHNIKSSDLRYITKAADKAGVHFDVPYLDTYILGRRFREQMGWEKLTLSYLSGLYGFEHKEVHRAWSDAEVNVRVYFEMQKLNRAMNME